VLQQHLVAAEAATRAAQRDADAARARAAAAEERARDTGPDEATARRLRDVETELAEARRQAAAEEALWDAAVKAAEDRQRSAEAAADAARGRVRELQEQALAGARRERELGERCAEQQERIAALNDEWASLQAEGVAVEQRLRTEMHEKHAVNARLSALQDDLNAYVGDADRREAELARAAEAADAQYRAEKDRLLDTIQQFVTEIDFWKAQAAQLREMAHRIPSKVVVARPPSPSPPVPVQTVLGGPLSPAVETALQAAEYSALWEEPQTLLEALAAEPLSIRHAAYPQPSDGPGHGPGHGHGHGQGEGSGAVPAPSPPRPPAADGSPSLLNVTWPAAAAAATAGDPGSPERSAAAAADVMLALTPSATADDLVSRFDRYFQSRFSALMEGDGAGAAAAGPARPEIDGTDAP